MALASALGAQPGDRIRSKYSPQGALWRVDELTRSRLGDKVAMCTSVESGRRSEQYLGDTVIVQTAAEVAAADDLPGAFAADLLASDQVSLTDEQARAVGELMVSRGWTRTA